MENGRAASRWEPWKRSLKCPARLYTGPPSRWHPSAPPNARVGHLGRGRRVATNAGEPEVKKFYQYLADWEKQHLEALHTLYNSVRTDFFAAGSFSPLPTRISLRRHLVCCREGEKATCGIHVTAGPEGFGRGIRYLSASVP